MQSWESRKEFLFELEKEVISKFILTLPYNVLIFGSFLTDKFDKDTSDLDLAIYCEDPDLLVDLYNFIDNYLRVNLEIPYDIIIIDKLPGYFINIDPLLSSVRITEYYPIVLKKYLYSLIKEQQLYNEFNTSIEWSKIKYLENGR